MPGAEAALLGVGILCNAMQIITFAKDSIHVYRNIRDNRSPDPKLDSYLKNARASFDEMNKIAAQMGPLGHAQQQIVDVGTKVHDCVDELQQRFAKLHVDGSERGFRGRLAASKKSAGALFHGKELEDAEKNLQRHEQLLHSLFLARICTQSQATEITSLQSFQHLEGTLQSIISMLADGSTKVSDLVADFASSMSKQLVEEHAATRITIEDHVASAKDTIHQSISQSVDQLHQELIKRKQEKTFEKQYGQLLSSLWFPDMNSRKNHISSNYPGTFDWIFDGHGSLLSGCGTSSEPGQSSNDSRVFEDTRGCDIDVGHRVKCVRTTEQPGFDCFPVWLESGSNLFWISGKPASGKSSLVKFLAFNHLTVDHLRIRHSNVRILSYFFWKPGQLLQRNVEGMTLSLLHQVLDGEPDLSRRLCEAQPPVRRKRIHSDWSHEELSTALVWALEASPGAFCIFLDGLDEAKELEHLPWPDWTNAQVIHKLLQVKHVKLCASSREERPFCRFFAKAFRLRLHQLNNSDITHFVRERLDICGLECRDRDELISRTVQKAEGVFLWVALVVNSLNRAIRQGYATNEMLEERLEQTPSDLTTLYTDMWDRIGDDGRLPSARMAASRCFSFVILIRKLNNALLSLNLPVTQLNWSTSSLLVMATASEDVSIEEMLNAGRGMTVEELLARCSKVETELNIVCGGLLEVTMCGQDAKTNSLRRRVMKGDKRICDYDFKEVGFIHRSAFDFLTDTAPGQAICEGYGPSEGKLASRLLLAHFIRVRFMYFKEGLSLDYKSMTMREKEEYRSVVSNPSLEVAITLALDNRRLSKRPFMDSLLNVIREW